MDWTITGGDVLGPEGLERRDLYVVDRRISEVPGVRPRVLDAVGLTVAPGMVDLHGDAFERNFSPRPGVFFDVETALIDTDRQLLTNGITTAYLAMTISWEPGLRSLENAKALVAAWQHMRPHFVTDLRLQLRWEIFALDAVETVEAWLRLDPSPMLAFNDHFSALVNRERRLGRTITEYAKRAGLSEDAYRALTADTEARTAEVGPACARLAQAAAEAGVPCLAHDEMTGDERRRNRSLGIAISEFPMSRDAAQTAIDGGEATVLGAPNIVRGGSHIGALDAEPAAVDGLCSALATDYFYPALLAASARLSDRGDLSPAAVWSLVSTNPARAAGLPDRTGFFAGARADIVLYRRVGRAARVEACFANGALGFSRLVAT